MSGELNRLLLRSAWQELSSEVKAWVPRAELESGLTAWLGQELARCDDAAFAARFSAACPVAGTTPADYLPRVVKTPSGHRALVGIRFVGGDVGQPFVEVVASTGPLRPSDALREMFAVIEAEFACFSPRAMRVFRACEHPSPPMAGLHARVDQAILAAPLKHLAARTAPKATAPLVFEPVDDPVVAADFVADVYARLFTERPSLVPVLYPADRDQLAECAATGCLGFGTVGGEKAGLIGAAAGTAFGLAGFEVIEEVLDTPWRGRGLAPVLQRGMVDAMVASGRRGLLFGTIDARNRPSLATAARVGRVRIAELLFIRSGAPFGPSDAATLD